MRRFTTPILIVYCGTALACARGTEPQGCDICTTSTVVYGTVRSVAGVAVSGVRITVDARKTSCSANSIGALRGPATTDSQGFYRAIVISYFAPTAVCLITTAAPPGGSSYVGAADTGHVVRLQPDYPPGQQSRDSVRVDLVLPSNM